MQKGLVKCPNGHSISSSTAHPLISCNLCHNLLDSNQLVYHCPVCDWDSCEKCGTIVFSPPVSSFRCPNGHALLNQTPHPPATCSRCLRPIEQSDPLLHCNICEWEQCKKCTGKEGAKNDSTSNTCILLIGAPASGKGTQAENIKKNYGFYHLATGDLLRDEIKNKTVLGIKAKEYMNDGKLVPDELIFQIINRTLAKPECTRVMFDGFPRTIEQARVLSDIFRARDQRMGAVIYLDVPDEELVKRGTGRRIHMASGRSYHVIFKPPKVPDKDDVTGEPLIQRDDDKEETIRKRLIAFHKNNTPIIEYYDAQGVVYKVQGNGKIEEVWKTVDSIVKKVM